MLADLVLVAAMQKAVLRRGKAAASDLAQAVGKRKAALRENLARPCLSCH